jgi:threonine dehydratase
MTATPARPSIDDVRRASRRIGGLATPTPLVRSWWLSSVTGADVWLKLESAQRTGSFKMRGAANAIARLMDRAPDTRAVVTASAGNHGQAVAAASRALGLTARIHLPATAPAAKRDAILRLGGEIVEAPTYDEAESRAHEDADRTGMVFVSPYDDTDVIAGAGTAALEMLQGRRDIDVIIAPVGGGGLLSGTAIVARALRPSAVVIGAEATASPAFTSALAAGRPVRIDVRETLADGLAGNMDPDTRTFAIVRDLVDRVVAVSEDEIAGAMGGLLLEDQLVAEGAAATAIAALVQIAPTLAGHHVGVILSGRNVDPGVLRRVLGSSRWG